MRKTLTLIFTMLSFSLLGQVALDQTFHDFGEIYKGGNRVAEFNLMNNSDKKLFILRADQDRELDIRFSTKTVEPGAYATIRIQVNPRTKGRFKKNIDLWISTSMEPFPLELIGEVKELETSFQPCPSFTHPDKIQPIQFSMTASVTDINTELPVKSAGIQMLRNGIPMEIPLITDERGKASKEIPLGLYYVVTRAEGYKTHESSAYLNRSRKVVEIALTPLEKTEEVPLPDTPKESIAVAPPIEEKSEPVVAIETDPSDFSPEKYAANNIVFLIDVSGSMRKEGRLDLLKASMLELVKILRDIDKVSILTYTATSKMVMESLSATEGNKVLMVSIIQGLEAKGSTQGGQALRLAFEVVKVHYVKNGSNQVMMATDGRFGDNYSEMLKVVKSNTRTGRNISVIGIKNSERSATQMHEIATIGAGYYINIESYDDAQENLVKGIKASCMKE